METFAKLDEPWQRRALFLFFGELRNLNRNLNWSKSENNGQLMLNFRLAFAVRFRFHPNSQRVSSQRIAKNEPPGDEWMNPNPIHCTWSWCGCASVIGRYPLTVFSWPQTRTTKTNKVYHDSDVNRNSFAESSLKLCKSRTKEAAPRLIT